MFTKILSFSCSKMLLDQFIKTNSFPKFRFGFDKSAFYNKSGKHLLTSGRQPSTFNCHFQKHRSAWGACPHRKQMGTFENNIICHNKKKNHGMYFGLKFHWTHMTGQAEWSTIRWQTEPDTDLQRKGEAGRSWTETFSQLCQNVGISITQDLQYPILPVILYHSTKSPCFSE